MANITVTVQSLINTAVYDSYTIADSSTVSALQTAVATARGYDTSWFALVLNDELLDGADTFANVGIVSGSVIRTANKISDLANRELKQKAKMELAALDRASSSRRAIYDLEELPTHYSTNTIVDNSNPDGLLEGRPWVDISRTNLQFYIDPSAKASYPGTGTAITDLSTNGYTGINMLNGVGFSASDADGSWTFDGSNDYIDTNQSLAQSNSFTLIAWIKVSNVTNYRMIISKEQTIGSPWNYRMYINITNGLLVGDIAPATGSGGSVNGTTNVADGTWHMVAFTRDVTADTLNVYVDDGLERSVTDPTTAAITGSQEVWIGRSAFTQGGVSPTGSYPFMGSMGEVMIYDRALTASDIAITFRATRSRYGV